MEKAFFRILHQGKDVTPNWQPYLVSLTITDERGRHSDKCVLVLDDSKQNLALIDTGSWLDVYLGYEHDLRPFGTYQCNKIDLDELAGTYTVTAQAADFKQSLMAPNDATYGPTTLDALTRIVAERHGYIAKVHPDLINASIPHIDQVSESDMAMLIRVAKEHDALVKPLAGHLIVKPAAIAKTLNNNDTYHLKLDRQSKSDFTCTLSIQERQNYNSVVAHWYDETTQSRQSVHAGNGEPIYTLSGNFGDEVAALNHAKGKLAQLGRQKATLTLNLPGTPDLVSESSVSIKNHREGYNGDWDAESVTHQIGAENVFTTTATATPKEK
ncbi:contractile injection system protein, VgrG/Pvc8 family [Vibrio sp. YMD68]|uniref:phage late control D family protein n=1 Tax=Vibrio sp. YMD68 TaxID=3042300 RepID=UPI00249B807A|nr:contractile injection system protein, VgrG/Pvc8 family [Vibrio sp. YMD68]WGV98814.1 contractile injection system protein, VgrG/Pvc8 family [Vibrio sp. YMD68]WGW01259.1 contractile injection system protein, VgrG/Pvc8 family [Vibrio sp. YMD68]